MCSTFLEPSILVICFDVGMYVLKLPTYSQTSCNFLLPHIQPRVSPWNLTWSELTQLIHVNEDMEIMRKPWLLFFLLYPHNFNMPPTFINTTFCQKSTSASPFHWSEIRVDFSLEHFLVIKKIFVTLMYKIGANVLLQNAPDMKSSNVSREPYQVGSKSSQNSNEMKTKLESFRVRIKFIQSILSSLEKHEAECLNVFETKIKFTSLEY